jgi:hypothetical protein
MSGGARIAAAAVGWGLCVALLAPLAPARTAAWIDWPALVQSGAHAWPAAAAWGTRCRWIPGSPAERQRFADACGPAALAAALRPPGPRPTQELLWSICRSASGGTTLGRLARAARGFGRPCRVGWLAPVDSAPVPAIVHLRDAHFVLLLRAERGAAWILDPAFGRLLVPVERLRARASGAVLVLGETASGTPATEEDPL